MDEISQFQNAMQADKCAIVSALSVLFDNDDVIELRALHKGKKRTDAGYFDSDHRDDLVDAAARLNSYGAAVYVTLNQIDPQLLGRYYNRIENYAPSTSTDANVQRRRWLLLDFDPTRPKDTGATDAQLEAAKVTAGTCYSALQQAGWPEPTVAESGNGVHLLYPLDLPNDNEARDLVKGALAGLAACFDDEVVTLDQSVFNAGRITKLYGTVANKGDSTQTTPWRLSRLVSTPQRDVTVTEEQLRAQHLPSKQSTTPSIPWQHTPGAFDLPDFMSRLGIAFELDNHNGADRYKLAYCPFNPEHGKGEAAIFRQANGQLGFKCQHASCGDRHWQDVRAIVDGPRNQHEGLWQYRRNATEGNSEAWPAPQPMTAKIAPEDYPRDALPNRVRAAVEEVARFVQAPFPMVASCALSALSLAIQAHIDVKRAENLTGPVGAYWLIIADSGERKSTCDEFFSSAILDYQTQQAELAKPILKKYRAECEVWEARHGGIKDKIRQLAKEGKPTSVMESSLHDLECQKLEPPRITRLIYQDVTPEKLAFNLSKGWPSGGIMSAEGGFVFGSHGMSGDSVMRNLATLNQLWDGKTLTIDRKTSESFTVRGARFTMALLVQEQTLRSFFKQSGDLARGTGFLARFFVAWPESKQGTRPFAEAPDSWPALAEFNRRITEILNQPAPISDDGILTPLMLDLAHDAKQAWIEYHDAIESNLASGGDLHDVRDVASKSADNAVRLAALFQVFEHGASSVSLDSFDSASRIAAWHLTESKRFFGELALAAEMAAAARLDSWLIEHCRREKTCFVGKRNARQYGPIRNGDALDAAIRELADLDRVRIVKESKRITIHLNPALVIDEGAL